MCGGNCRAVVEDGLRLITCGRLPNMKPNDDTMHMGFLERFVVPTEGAVREVDCKSLSKKRLPERRHAVALRD